MKTFILSLIIVLVASCSKQEEIAPTQDKTRVYLRVEEVSTQGTTSLSKVTTTYVY